MSNDFYQISDLERLSGIKAHTIRIWEKRYGLVTPHRTDTNIRYYDDEQLKKLLNVATLSNVGFKISKIASLTEVELKDQILRSQRQEKSDLQFDFYVNDFIAATLDFDETRFDVLFNEVVAKYGFQQAVVKVIYPFLFKTGVLWRVADMMPVQEHFASNLIKRKFFTLIDGLPKLPNLEKKFLLFLPAGEWHEIGLLFAEYLIRLKGFDTVSLGQNVPFVDIEFVIKKTNPDYLLTFLISGDHSQEMSQIQKLISGKYKHINCLISGPWANIQPYDGLKDIVILKDPSDLLKYL
ncbi:MAG: MerR family transcriptional regulator [Chitinophagaceae bacterium]|nr:MerR family transcriptional regulator [Chitinophagaceae bacterium]